ncbi:MAG TPA: peptidoglycan editing factor PgeF [Holosporales bacterium]|nr:peptidoglycan editing factor PgeF [Holosporales bacterium]
MTTPLKPLQSTSFPSNLDHGFFTRQGGNGTGLFNTLNVGLSKGDHRETVITNREKIAYYFQSPLTSLCFAKQVHGSHALFIDEPYDLNTPPTADALITNVPGLIMGVQTADCVPVLLYDPTVPLVAALHGGWKGVLSGIIENTVALMLKRGAKRKTLMASIGPSIAQNSYEVDEIFQQTFREKNHDWSKFFKQGTQKGKHFFDLEGFVKQKLQEESLKSIHSLNQDTYTNDTLFFSCRRAFHNEEPTFGNQASCIVIRS